MSTLSQFAPFAGGGLKSFQTGYTNGLASTGSGEDGVFIDVTISSVSTTKAIPGVYGAGLRSAYGFAAYYQGWGASAIPLPRLTSGTNLRIGNPQNAGASFDEGTRWNFRWQVAEAN